MKPLSEVPPAHLVIQIQIQAVRYEQRYFIAQTGTIKREEKINTI